MRERFADMQMCRCADEKIIITELKKIPQF